MDSNYLRALARRALYLAACATPPIETDNPIAVLLSQVHESDIPWPDHAGVVAVEHVNGEHIGVELCLFAIRPRFKCEILYRHPGEIRMRIDRILDGQRYRQEETHSVSAMFQQYSPADSFEYFLDRADREFAKLEDRTS